MSDSLGLPFLFAAGDSSTLYYYLGLAALVGAMIWAAIVAHSSWVEANEDLDPASPAEVLEALEQAHAAGDLDEEELARARRLIKKTK